MPFTFIPGPGPGRGLVEKGAKWMDSVRELAAHSDVIISIVGYPRDVAQIYLDADGILESAATGSVAIDA